MQGTAAREVRQEILHLIGQNTMPFQIDVFGISWAEWHSQQLQARLFGCAARFVVVTPATRSDYICPNVPATQRERRNVIAR